jgi:hypothetical protein
MAGDLGFEEILVIHDSIGAPPAPGAAATERRTPRLDPEVEQARVLQRFGDRVEIRAGASESMSIGKSVRPGNAGQLGLEDAMPS